MGTTRPLDDSPTLRPEDIFAIGLLQESVGLAVPQIRSLHARYLATVTDPTEAADPDDDFVSFLADEGLFSSAAPTLVRLMQQGSIQTVEPDRMLPPRGLTQLPEFDSGLCGDDGKLVDWLVEKIGHPAITSAGVQSWWTENRSEDEGLADFLTRNEILTPLAVFVWDLHQVGDRSEPEPEQVHTPAALSRLKSVVRRAAAPGGSSRSSLSSTAILSKSAGGADGQAVGPGMMVGRVELLGKLADGEFGPTFRGLHQSLKVTVTVAFIQQKWLSESNLINRFRERAESLARLNHPNVLRLWDFGFEPSPYLSTEEANGPTLAELVNQTGRLAPHKVIDLMAQALAGLSAAAEAGVGRREVTAADVVITHDGTAKLTNLGLAGLGAIDGEEGQVSLLSVGRMMYHLLTGRQAAESPTPIVQLVPGIDAGLADLVHELLADSPSLERQGALDDLPAKLTELKGRLGDAFKAPAPAKVQPATDDSSTDEESKRGKFSFWKVVNSVFTRK